MFLTETGESRGVAVPDRGDGVILTIGANVAVIVGIGVSVGLVVAVLVEDMIAVGAEAKAVQLAILQLITAIINQAKKFGADFDVIFIRIHFHI